MRLRIYVSRASFTIINNNIFEAISIIVIGCNSISLTMQDPTVDEEIQFLVTLDIIFQALYTVEMVLKISALGFIIKPNSYLREPWNILDFVIVISGYIPYLFKGSSTNITALRTFRVLRPLKTISSIEGLRVIVRALIASMPLLRDALLVILFFFIIFAIGGVQLFQGILKNRCVEIETGIVATDNDLCGGA
mmetsp:Transcript_22888/g.22176  ORF Transcript_22888/g.22176 Transcript_22888/m.22176 type:complete len:193 (+) Transcript_22888:521-1099(+)